VPATASEARGSTEHRFKQALICAKRRISAHGIHDDGNEVVLRAGGSAQTPLVVAEPSRFTRNSKGVRIGCTGLGRRSSPISTGARFRPRRQGLNVWVPP
jgi:hypothetical protein